MRSSRPSRQMDAIFCWLTPPAHPVGICSSMAMDGCLPRPHPVLPVYLALFSSGPRGRTHGYGLGVKADWQLK